MKTVNIYTDGACSGNQNEKNTGGWGCVLEYGGTTKELWGGEPDTTNNRMEMLALISALSALKEDGLRLHIYSDSSYLINCMKQKWYVNWRRNGWKTSQRQPVENRELWEKLLTLSEGQTIEYYLVKGHLKTDADSAALKAAHKKYTAHNGPCTFEEFKRIAACNNRADALANEFIKQAAKTAGPAAE
jgi:ribonuclease HI